MNSLEALLLRLDLASAPMTTRTMLGLLLFTVCLSGGCGRSGIDTAPSFFPLVSPDGVNSSDSAVFDVLQHVDFASLQTAFDTLDTVTFTVVLVTREGKLDADAETIIRTLRIGDTIRHVNASAQSLGTVESFFSRFRDTSDTALSWDAVATGVVPDNPSYLSARGREAYSYFRLPDTAWGGQSVQTYAVAARPRVGDDQAIRQARLYVDPETQGLVGYYEARRERALLYSEHSEVFLQARRQPDGFLLADSIRTQLLMTAPLQHPLRTELMVEFTEVNRSPQR